MRSLIYSLAAMMLLATPAVADHLLAELTFSQSS